MNNITVPMPKVAALAICQLQMGDYVVLKDGRVMRLDSYDCYTKNFIGRVMMQERETQSAVPVKYLRVWLDENGEAHRLLDVRSGAFPVVKRVPVAGFVK